MIAERHSCFFVLCTLMNLRGEYQELAFATQKENVSTVTRQRGRSNGHRSAGRMKDHRFLQWLACKGLSASLFLKTATLMSL